MHDVFFRARKSGAIVGCVISIIYIIWPSPREYRKATFSNGFDNGPSRTPFMGLEQAWALYSVGFGQIVAETCALDY